MSGCIPVPLYPGQTFHPNPSFQSQHQPGAYNQHHQYDQINQYQQNGHVRQQHNQQQFQNLHLHNPYHQFQNYPSQTSLNPSVSTAYHSQTSFQPSHQPYQEFHPLIPDNAGKKQPEPFVQEIPKYKQPKRRRADHLTTVLLFAVWAFLTMSCVVLLYSALVVSQDSGEAGANVTGSEIGGVIMLAAPFTLVVTILNELLVDRAWRRVMYTMLTRNSQQAGHQSITTLTQDASITISPLRLRPLSLRTKISASVRSIILMFAFLLWIM